MVGIRLPRTAEYKNANDENYDESVHFCLFCRLLEKAHFKTGGVASVVMITITIIAPKVAALMTGSLVP